MGESPELTCKMDVFALGVLFHQYFAGTLPAYDTELGSYAGEAVARGGTVTVSQDIPDDVRVLLTRMLDADPRQRPMAAEVFATLAGRQPEPDVEPEPEPKSEPEQEPKPEPAADTETVAASTTGTNPFFMPGDL